MSKKTITIYSKCGINASDISTALEDCFSTDDSECELYGSRGETKQYELTIEIKEVDRAN